MPSTSPVTSAGLWTSTPGQVKVLPLTGLDPVVGSGPSGFAIAVQGTSGPLFTTYSASGAVQCGPVSMGDSSFKPAGIVATPKGYLVVSSGVVRGQEVHSDCSLGPIFAIDAGPKDDMVRVAAGAAGYGVVWQDGAAKVPKRRLFGANFCD